MGDRGKVVFIQKEYRIYWGHLTNSYFYTVRIDDVRGHNLEQAILMLNAWAKSTRNTLREISDLGQVPLYRKMEGDLVVVDMVWSPGFDPTPISASNVGVGTFLAGSAKDFFEWWKGTDAVRDRELVK